jgi:hypothetical protein
MFEDKARNLFKSGAPKRGFLTSLANSRLDWIDLDVTNTLAYLLIDKLQRKNVRHFWPQGVYALNNLVSWPLVDSFLFVYTCKLGLAYPSAFPCGVDLLF